MKTTAVILSAVRAELDRIADQFDRADRRRAKAAATIADREAAEAEQQEAAGIYWSAGESLTQLLLLMLRFAIEHEPDLLRERLVEALRPELEPLAEDIARLEDRR